MQEQLQKLKEMFNAQSEMILHASGLSPESPEPQICVSNTGLLLDTLESFTKQENAKFLPKTIQNDITNQLLTIISELDPIDSQSTPDKVSSVLIKLDMLYVNCLKYGLITFGFSSKEALAMVEQIKGYKDEVAHTSTESRKNITQKNKGFDKLIEEANKKIQSTEASLALNVQTIIDDYKTKAEKQLAEAAGVVGKINLLQQGVDENKKAIDSEQTAITGLKGEIAKTKETLSKELQQIQGEHQTISTQASTATTLAADIKTRNEDSAKLLANIQSKEKQINEFYQNMGKYKEDILTFQKDIGEKYTGLIENTDSKIKSFDERTELIIKQNEYQQKQITELLAKAVGVSLFTAFGKQKKWLFVSRIICLAVLVGAVVGVCWLVWHLAAISTTPNTIFFIRLSLVAPLAFLIWFVTMQYGKERHSEEEYAFKSAISISLEPYRDLLKKMREDKAIETDFVQKLMEEVFANPVRHIYKDHSESKEFLEHKYEVVEIIKEVSGIIEKIQNMDDFISGKSQLINLLGKFCHILRPGYEKKIAKLIKKGAIG
jgi:hypothetical protein